MSQQFNGCPSIAHFAMGGAQTFHQPQRSCLVLAVPVLLHSHAEQCHSERSRKICGSVALAIARSLLHQQRHPLTTSDQPPTASHPTTNNHEQRCIDPSGEFAMAGIRKHSTSSNALAFARSLPAQTVSSRAKSRDLRFLLHSSLPLLLH